MRVDIINNDELIYSTNADTSLVVAVDLVANRFVSLFFAYPSSYTTGIQVAGFVPTIGGRGEIVTCSGPGTTPLLEFFTVPNNQLGSFFPFEASFLGGGFVG